MKSPEKTVFETILLIAAIVALALLPLSVEAQAAAKPGEKHGPPAFTEVDADGDGFVSEAEFNSFRAERHKAMAEAGRPMKGLATAPSFAEVDADGDGKVTAAELKAAQQAHRQAMHANKGQGMGQGQGMRHGQHGEMKMPSFGDLDLDGNGCIDADEFAQHQAEMHGAPAE